MSKHTQNLLSLKDKPIKDYINSYCKNIDLQELNNFLEISELPILHIVPIIEIVEQYIRKWMKKSIP